jgi:hypothetical protein
MLMAKECLTLDTVERKDEHGRYANAFDDFTLLAIVRRICLYVSAHVAPTKSPEKTTQARFDEHREAAGYPTVKRAYAIAQQLGVTWPRLLEAIFTSDASVHQLLVAAGRAAPIVPTREAAIESIKAIARRRNTTVLTIDDYAAELASLGASESLHWRHKSGVIASLLTANQIAHAFNWTELVVEAGLELPPTATKQGMPHPDAIEMFLCELGYVPSGVEELRRYASEKGFSLKTRDPNGGGNIRTSIEIVRTRWAALGRWVPDATPAKNKRPPWKVVPRADHGVVPAKRRRWTYEECLESLVTVLGEIEGKELTLNRYRTIATGRRDLAPQASVINIAKNHGSSFVAMRDEATRLRLRNINGGADYADRMEELPPEVDTETLTKRYAPQFEAAQNLLVEAWRNRPRGSAESDKYLHVIFTIFARATKTYRAVIHLCKGGYTDQADMLIRSLFEDMAIALWVSLPEHREEAFGLLEKRNAFGRLLAADSLERHADWLGETFDADDIEQLEQSRDEYEKLFGRYGDRSWVGKSLWEVLNEIEQLWEDEERRKRELWGFYALGHRINNEKLHNSAVSLGGAARDAGFDKDGALAIRNAASPSDEELGMMRAIYGAMFTYGRITRLVIELAGGDVDAFDEFYARQLDFAYRLAPKYRHQVGRNDLCPCGSGKKYKLCHGA